jgi:Flp pilus assembly protein CpaB
LTRADLPKLIVKKQMAKDSLPQAFVTSEDELIDRRLTRPVLKDEPFNPGSLTKGGVITLPEGKHMVALPIGVSNGVAGFVGPGSKVDVLATLKLDSTLEAFPLLVDMLILAVDGNVSYDTSKNGVFANMSTVSFAVTQEEALLLALAKQRGCHLELLLRHPGTPLDKDYDIKKIKKLLESDKSPSKLVVTGRPGEVEGAKGVNEPDVKPLTPDKTKDLVRVWVANENIAKDTPITKDLIAQKFAERAVPKEFADEAVGDLSAFLGKALVTGVSKGQWVTGSMLGQPGLRPSPLEDFNPKPGPNDKIPVIPPAQRKIVDIAVHTASGTVINRFEEVRPGEWKLKAVMTPEEATAKAPKDPAPVAPDGK